MSHLLSLRTAFALGITAMGLSVATTAAAEDAPCPTDVDKCRAAPLLFLRDETLPVMGGFDTGFIPQGSPIQVRLFAEIFASTQVAMKGNLHVAWPEALTLSAVPDPDGGTFGIHYGADIGAEGALTVTVLGQTFNWTGPIPFVPQFDFQVDASEPFQPWAFDPGVSVSGETMLERLAQVDVTDFIGINIPGLSGGFALDVWVELEATYRTERIAVRDVDTDQEVASFTAEGASSTADFVGGGAVDYEVVCEGAITYDGVLHLVPTFFVNTLGPDLSIPVADVPIPFSFADDDFDFPPVAVHARLPDVALASTQPIALGDARVGVEVANHVSLENEGEARLVVTARVEGDASFSVPTPALVLEPGFAADLSIAFRPGTAGDASATLVLETNDPDEPEIRIPLGGRGTPIDDGSGGGGGEGGSGGGDDGGEAELRGGGCSCRTASTGEVGRGWVLLALGAILFGVRRRPAASRRARRPLAGRAV